MSIENRESGEQPREEEPIEQISEAAAKEIEDLRDHYAGLEKIGDIEKDIRRGGKVLDNMRKNQQGDPEEIIPYWELRIKLAKAEIKRREIKGER